MNDKKIPLNGLGPVTTQGAKKEAEKVSASEHRKNKKPRFVRRASDGALVWV